NQAGPSIRAIYPVSDIGQLEAGVFDSSATTAGTPAADLTGSTVWRNYYGQMRFQDFGVKGLSGVVGYEGLYTVDATTGDDSVDPIFDVGVDYRTDLFDASVEWIALDQNIAGTTDDETYWVAELTAFLKGGWTAMADFASADELDATTTRLGTQFG